METSSVISLITLGAVIIGAVVNVSGLIGKRESKAASDARMEVKLDNIYLKVDGMEKKVFNIDSILQQHGERITKVEESTKSAHHRIDKIENKKGD